MIYRDEHGQGKSQGKIVFKVRELSGIFEVGQGILEIKQKVLEKSGNFEITSIWIIKIIKYKG